MNKDTKWLNVKVIDPVETTIDPTQVYKVEVDNISVPVCGAFTQTYSFETEERKTAFLIDGMVSNGSSGEKVSTIVRLNIKDDSDSIADQSNYVLSRIKALMFHLFMSKQTSFPIATETSFLCTFTVTPMYNKAMQYKSFFYNVSIVLHSGGTVDMVTNSTTYEISH